jgi:hypothetical protein
MSIKINKNDESEWQEFSRIRSKRSRKRASIEDKDKQLIRLYKEDKALTKQKYDLPMIDLVPPIQRGWKRYFILREDVRRSKKAVFYENILQKINTFQYSSSKEFKKKAKRGGKKIYKPREQHLRVIYKHELAKFKLSELEFACFELKTKQEIIGKKIYEKQFFEFKEPWRFVFRIRPNLIDKVQVVDTELEQKLAELNAILYENSENNGRLRHLKDWGYNRRWKECAILKYKNPLKNMTFHQILESDL